MNDEGYVVLEATERKWGGVEEERDDFGGLKRLLRA